MIEPQYKRREVFVYHDGEFLGRCLSMLAAAKIAGTSQPTVRSNVDKRVTKDKYYFSSHELTGDEIKELFKEKPVKEKRTINYRVKKVGNQEYAVGANKMVTYVPPARQAAISALREFIYAKLGHRWMVVNKKISALERQRVAELLEALK